MPAPMTIAWSWFIELETANARPVSFLYLPRNSETCVTGASLAGGAPGVLLGVCSASPASTFSAQGNPRGSQMTTSILNHTVKELIHESANSLVYRAHRDADGAPRVLKVLKANYPTAEERTRYQQEYDITRSLDVAGVIKVFEFARYENSLVMVMEDFGGESLARWTKRRSFEIHEILTIFSTASAITARIHHSGVIHKDINPSNIVYNPETGVVKIIDFGISTRLSHETTPLKNPRVLEGTLAYMSPEQTGRMNRFVDYRTDFYSLGATLYELLTGQIPFPQKNDQKTADAALRMVHSHLAKEPPEPFQVNPEVPEAVSDIVKKLMSKTAEARYQSGWGVQADLDHCLGQLNSGAQLEPFTLGSKDFSEQFQIPQKLYGREGEIEDLLETFARTSRAQCEMVLVAGYSGIGKSALVQELYTPITQQRGFFIRGKFDQLQRNTPYSALVDAFAGLMLQLLTEDERQLETWRGELQKALGPNAQVIIDVIPELELIVGPQPPVKQLGASESQNRFNLVMQNFVRVFCRPEHPLVMFLDDLQWSDAATLKLLELIMASSLDCFLLIGAYRDNEVAPHDPLMLTLGRLREDGVSMTTFKLRALSLWHITQLVEETLHCTQEEASPLAALVVAKTRGNPFFVTQFLQTLHQEKLLTFRAPQVDNPGGWQWSMDAIQALDTTDNVVDLMITKLRRFPEATQKAIRLAACIGNQFALDTLAMILEVDEAQTHADILPAVESGLILPNSALETRDATSVDTELVFRRFRFLHDRVQQSAYALIDDDKKQPIHLKIGRLLIDNLRPEEQSERVFELVDHLNVGRHLTDVPDELLQIVRLNLEAGKKAKFATAYEAASSYLTIAQDTLSVDSWDANYELTLDVFNNQTELTYLTGDFEGVERLVRLVLDKARSAVDKAQVYKLLLVQYTVQGRYDKAIEIGREALGLLGVELPREEVQAGIAAELAKAEQSVGDRSVASLIDNPEVTDPKIKEIQKLLVYVTPAAFLGDQELFALLNLVSVNLSLAYGNVAESALGFANYGITLGSHLGNYQLGHEFGLLGLQICQKYDGVSEKAPVCLIYGVELAPWVQHAKLCEPFLDEGYKAGLESGEVQWSGYLAMYKVLNRAFQGKGVSSILTDIDNFRPFSVKIKDHMSNDGMLAFQLCYRNLAGQTKDALSFHGDGLEEVQFLSDCKAHQGAMAICLFKVLKAHVLYLYGEYEQVVELCREAEPLLPYIVAHLQLSEQNMFYSLALAALYSKASDEQRAHYMAQMDKNQRQLKIWADNCPENYLHKYLLVAAEVASLRNDDLEAMDLYDRAIALAQEHDFVHYDALAKELAARFWFKRNKQRFAYAYLVDAHYAYTLWGATRKVAQLEQAYPFLSAKKVDKGFDPERTAKLSIAHTSTVRADGTERLDMLSVLKASRIVSGEIEIQKLLARSMAVVIENAGAQRGVLLLDVDGELHIEGVAEVDQNRAPSTAVAQTVVGYCQRVRKAIVLDQAVDSELFADDPHIAETQPASVLAMPLLNQAQLVGVLYLENHGSVGAFTADRVQVLEAICAQIVISIKNARLYETLEEYSHNLEAKVLERTQKLNEKNQKLVETLATLKATQARIVAQQRQASLGVVTAGIAHEMRNPLNFINNFAQATLGLQEELDEELKVLLQDSPEDIRESVSELLDEIRNGSLLVFKHGKRVAKIVDDMVMLSSRGKRHYETVELNEVVRVSAKLAHHGAVNQFANFEVEMSMELDSAVETTEAIPGDINHALLHVIGNALYAAHSNSSVHVGSKRVVVSTEDLGSAVKISVLDNGEGIPEDIRDKIFTPFFTTKPPNAGSGLGLSICYDIFVQQHGGTMDVESEPGKFTRFDITVPKSARRR